MAKSPNRQASHYNLEDVVGVVFQAIKRHAPEALVALRDGEAIDQWAARYRLESELIKEHALGLRHIDPEISVDEYGLPLSGMWGARVIGMSVEYARWWKAVWPPFPSNETKGRWLKRAARLYDEAARVDPGMPLPPKWPEMRTHCAWFVQFQVLELSPDRIAELIRDEKNREGSAVLKAVKLVARVIGVTLRPHPRRRVRRPKRTGTAIDNHDSYVN